MFRGDCMNSSNIKNYIDIIAVSLTILGSFGIAILDNWIVKVVVGVLLAVIIAASILYKQIKQRKQAMKTISTQIWITGLESASTTLLHFRQKQKTFDKILEYV